MEDIKEVIIRSQVGKVGQGNAPSTTKPNTSRDPAAFEKALDEQSLKISKHALRRLDSRQIELTRGDQDKLNEAVNTLDKKGAKDSLVLMGELAFIVNVPNKTVVTAMEKDQMQEQVFTKIDSTILLEKQNSEQ